MFQSCTVQSDRPLPLLVWDKLTQDSCDLQPKKQADRLLELIAYLVGYVRQAGEVRE